MKKKTTVIFTILIAAAAVVMCTVSAEAFLETARSECADVFLEDVYKNVFSLTTFTEAPEEKGLVRLDSADHEKDSSVILTVKSSQETSVRHR